MNKLFFIDPLGAVSLETCAEVGRFLEATFGLGFTINPAQAPPVTAYNPLRGQYMAFRMLTHLEQGEADKGMFRRIGIFDQDLCTPILQYVFGLARLPGKACIISTFRLKPEHQGLGPDIEILHERICKEVLHELGHTFGLPHCPEDGCIMRMARGVAHIDQRSPDYCPACKETALRAVAVGR
jgi:archaemetzincin